jgi:hypothetical protein
MSKTIQESVPGHGVQTLSSSPVRATRRFLGLIGFLNKAEVDAFFNQLPISPADPRTQPADIWTAVQQHVARLQPRAVDNPQLSPVPDEAIPVIEQVRQRQSFKRWYEAVADYNFALAPFDSLLAPQWEADLDYIEEQSARAPKVGDWSAAFAFAMQEDAIGEPVVNQNQVIFSSHRRDLFCNPIPEIRSVEPGVYEIVVTAQSRPNFIQVASLNGRLVLVNGVHRALAMKRVGFAQIPCVFRQVDTHAELGLNPGVLFLRPETILGPRPALVADFLSEDLASPLLMRAMDQVLRIAVVTEPMTVPALG